MNVKKVSNPLTIIAIFASLAEVASTGALVALDGSVQMVFIWFVMGFPVLLVITFFYTLWKKPTSLYAPSDYDKEENFLDAIGVTKGLSETIDRLQSNLEELDREFRETGQGSANKSDLDEKINGFKAEISMSKGQIEKAKTTLQELQSKSVSTHLSLRIPEELRDKLANKARMEGKSINQLVNEAILEK